MFIAEGSGLNTQGVREDMRDLKFLGNKKLAAVIGQNFVATGTKISGDHLPVNMERLLVNDPKLNPLGAQGFIPDGLKVEFDHAGAPTPASRKALSELADTGIQTGKVKLEISSFAGGAAHAFLMRKRDVVGKLTSPGANDDIKKQFDSNDSELFAMQTKKPEFARVKSGGLAGLAGGTRNLDILAVVDSKGVLMEAFSYTQSGDTITLKNKATFDKQGALIATNPLDRKLELHSQDGVLSTKELDTVLLAELSPSRLEEVTKLRENISRKSAEGLPLAAKQAAAGEGMLLHGLNPTSATGINIPTMPGKGANTGQKKPER